MNSHVVTYSFILNRSGISVNPAKGKLSSFYAFYILMIMYKLVLPFS